jgi:hypothetical protein
VIDESSAALEIHAPCNFPFEFSLSLRAHELFAVVLRKRFQYSLPLAEFVPAFVSRRPELPADDKDILIETKFLWVVGSP